MPGFYRSCLSRFLMDSVRFVLHAPWGYDSLALRGLIDLNALAPVLALHGRTLPRLGAWLADMRFRVPEGVPMQPALLYDTLNSVGYALVEFDWLDARVTPAQFRTRAGYMRVLYFGVSLIRGVVPSGPPRGYAVRWVEPRGEPDPDDRRVRPRLSP